jgi:hypothetical protein
MVKLNPSATGGRVPGVGTVIDPSEHTMVSPSGGVSHLSSDDRDHNGYSRSAVNNAIASSNRFGPKIGGREAAAIHSLLKGRH